MRFLLAVFLCLSLPLQLLAQTVELEGVSVQVRPDLKLQTELGGSSELARVAGVGIVRGDGARQGALTQGRLRYLGAAQEMRSGRYGLISSEISFKIRAGARAPSLPGGLVVKPLVGKEVFLVEAGSVQEWVSTLAMLRADPAVEWAQSRFITDVNRPQ